MRIRFVAGVAEQLLESLRDAMLAPRALVCEPGTAPGEYVITGDGAQATDADRDATVAWLAARPDVVSFNVGPLGDVGSAA